MPKAAKKQDDAIEVQPASNSKVKEYTKRVIAANAEIKDAKEGLADLWVEAKNAGIDVKALKAAIKIIEDKPLQELRDTVNFYLESNGQMRFFA